MEKIQLEAFMNYRKLRIAASEHRVSSPPLPDTPLSGASIEPTPASLGDETNKEVDDLQSKDLDRLLGSLSLDQDVMRPPDNGEVDELIGILVGNKFRIDKLIRHDNHSDIYTVTYKDDATPSLSVEARAYTTSGIDRKLAQYRQQNMRRLEKRSLWKGSLSGKTIFVYQKDKEDDRAGDVLPLRTSGSNSQDATDIQNSSDDSFLGITDPPTVPETKRERVRLRQQKRLARQREARRSAEGESGRDTHRESSSQSRGVDRHGKNPTLEERTIDILVSLYCLQSYGESTLCQAPASGDDHRGGGSALASSALLSYLQEIPLESVMVNVQELEVFVKAKREEAEYMRKLHARLPGLQDETLQQYVTLCTKVVPKGEEADDWDERKKSALKIYRVLDHVSPFVAELLEKAERCHLWLARQLEFVKGEELTLRKESLEKLLSVLVPQTLVYGKVQAEVEIVDLARKGRDTSCAKTREQVGLEVFPELNLKLYREFVQAVKSEPSGS